MVIDVLGLFSIFVWHVTHGCLCNQALADVRSTGAEIECLSCSYKGDFRYTEAGYLGS